MKTNHLKCCKSISYKSRKNLNIAQRVILLLFHFCFARYNNFLQFCPDHQKVLGQKFLLKFENITHYLRGKIWKFTTQNQLKCPVIQLFKIHIILFFMWNKISRLMVWIGFFKADWVDWKWQTASNNTNLFFNTFRKFFWNLLFIAVSFKCQVYH